MIIRTMVNPYVVKPLEGHTSGALALVLRASRWFGVAPLSFKRERDGWRVSVCPKLTIYGYVLITLLNALMTFELISYVVTQKHTRLEMTYRFMWALNMCMMVISASAGAYFSTKRMNSTIACLNIMEKINNDLSLTSQKWHHISEGNKKLCFLVWSVIFTFLFTTNTVLTMFYESPNYNHALPPVSGVFVFVDNITFFVYNSMINILTAQFIMMAMSIVSSFRAINEHLKMILQDLKIKTLANNDDFSVHKNEKPLNMFESSPSGVAMKLHTGSSLSWGAAHESVRQLGMMFASLCDVQREVNRCHGPVLILLLTLLTLRLIFTPFYFLLDVFVLSTESDSEETYLKLLIQVLWCTEYCFALIMIIESGHRTQAKIKQMKELISSLLQYSYMTTEPLCVELETFVQQLALNKISYSPLGFTTLSRSVAAGLFGTIVTYMIVLVQLLQMNFKNQKH